MNFIIIALFLVSISFSHGNTLHDKSSSYYEESEKIEEYEIHPTISDYDSQTEESGEGLLERSEEYEIHPTKSDYDSQTEESREGLLERSEGSEEYEIHPTISDYDSQTEESKEDSSEQEGYNVELDDVEINYIDRG